MDLVKYVKDTVYEKFGKKIELEIKVLGEWPIGDKKWLADKIWKILDDDEQNEVEWKVKNEWIYKMVWFKK